VLAVQFDKGGVSLEIGQHRRRAAEFLESAHLQVAFSRNAEILNTALPLLPRKQVSETNILYPTTVLAILQYGLVLG
jgi:hypothetical protein